MQESDKKTRKKKSVKQKPETNADVLSSESVDQISYKIPAQRDMLPHNLHKKIHDLEMRLISLEKTLETLVQK